MRGKFWRAFQADGKLSALGYPRTESLQEGSNRVQYFQNGALQMGAAGNVARLPLGLTPVPAATPTPTAKPVATPHEGTITVGPSPTATRVRGTPTPGTHRTPTPTPRPAPSPTPTATTGAPPIDKVFTTFQRAHVAVLGLPAGRSWKVSGYVVQVFRYGGLVYNARARATWFLPVGDRLLQVRHYLPGHPGNIYPTGFAPASVLKVIHWL